MVNNHESNRIIRMREVCLKTGLSQSTIQDKVRAGLFPRGFKLVLGGRATGWYEADIDKYLAERKGSISSPRNNNSVNTIKPSTRSGGAE